MFREPRLRKQRLFQARPPKGFEYTPRYYDPEKERIDELKARANEAREAGDDPRRFIGNQIRAGGMRRRSNTRSNQWARLLRLAVILGTMIATLIALEGYLAK